jgi:hypothetical protein
VEKLIGGYVCTWKVGGDGWVDVGGWIVLPMGWWVDGCVGSWMGGRMDGRKMESEWTVG